MISRLILISTLFALGKSLDLNLLNHTSNENCDIWAERDNECINNPRYMWSQCIGSCIRFAKDNHDNCLGWAQEGECNANPNYMHLNCPRSCQMAISWSPWVRRNFQIDDVAYSSEELPIFNETSSSDLFEIAESMRFKVKYFLSGYSPVIPGFSTFAPSEYLGMLGLTESILYPMRIYLAMITELGSDEQIKNAEEQISKISKIIRTNFASDNLMLNLSTWASYLDETSDIVLKLLAPSVNSESQIDAETSEQASIEPLKTTTPEKLINFFGLENKTLTINAVQPTVNLSNNVAMPLMGLGTWLLEDHNCYDAVTNAVRSGFRLIDTAQAYANEEAVGLAIANLIQNNEITREELFVASKLSNPEDAGYHQVKTRIQLQLQALQTPYLDLYMLHSPLPDKRIQAETWQALEDLLEIGVLRSIGVSNFDINELDELLRTSRIPPMVLQNKLDVYHIGKQIDVRGDNLVKYTKDHNIVLLSYSPFSAYPFVMEPIHDPIVKYLATKKTKEISASLAEGESPVEITPSQILLKWNLQRNIATIPRSTDLEHLKQNIATLDSSKVPDLTEEEIKLLDTLQLLVSSPVSVPIDLL